MHQVVKWNFYVPIDSTHAHHCCLLSNSTCLDWSKPVVTVKVHWKANLKGMRKLQEFPPLRRNTYSNKNLMILFYTSVSPTVYKVLSLAILPDHWLYQVGRTGDILPGCPSLQQGSFFFRSEGDSLYSVRTSRQNFPVTYRWQGIFLSVVMWNRGRRVCPIATVLEPIVTPDFWYQEFQKILFKWWIIGVRNNKVFWFTCWLSEGFKDKKQIIY